MQKISNSEIREAFIEYQIMEAERLQKIAAESPHRFSLRFHLKMHSLLQKTADVKEGPSPVQRAIPIRKIGIVLIAVLLAVLGLCATAIAVRNAYRLIEKVFPRYSDVRYENPVSEERSEFVLYEVTEVPEGFVKDEANCYCDPSVGDALTSYQRENEYFVLEQQYADKAKSKLNTENVSLKSFTTGSITGYSFVNKGITYILWIEKEFALLLSGNISEDTLINIAEHVEPQ